MKQWGVVDTYLSFGLATRIIFAVMFIAGVVLCVSLWLTDVGIGFSEPHFVTRYNGEWLRSHAYIPNILAGVTGFLVGVPVALVVLQTVIGTREDAVEMTKAKRVSAAAWGDFHDAATKFASSTRRTALLNNATTDVYPRYMEIFNKLRGYRGNAPFEPPTQEQHDELVTFLKAKEASFKTEIDSVTTKVGNIDELMKLWTRVLSTWSVVNVYVRSRRIELDLPWFNEDSNSLLSMTLSTAENQLFDFTHIHSGFGPELPVVSMDMAHQWVLSYIRWDKAKLDAALLQPDGKAFGIVGLDDYLRRAQNAGVFLNSLDDTIRRITAEGWPDSSPQT